MGARRTSGLAVPIVLVVFFAMAAIGAGLVWLSRGVGRTSHWLHHAQLAFNLAEGGLSEALLVLQQATRPGVAPPVQMGPGALQNLAAIQQAMISRPAAGSTFTLFEANGAAAAGVTQSLLAMLDMLSQPVDLRPKLKIEVEFLSEKQLVDTPEAGILPLASERQGGMKLLASATVSPDVSGAIQVTRKLVAFRTYKVINILPSLFSKFPLFFQESPPVGKLNSLRVAFDAATGDAVRSGADGPLVLSNPVHAPLLKPGTQQVSDVDWKAQSGKADFLDDQGWVFLGDSSQGNPWVLNLAYGYSGAGDNFHLPNCKTRPLVDGTSASNDAFLRGAEQAIYNATGFRVNMTNYRHAPPNSYGLLWFTHGFAGNYQDIGYLYSSQLGNPQTRFLLPQGPFASRPLEASVVRPLGTADTMSPTVVLGPADRCYIRQAAFGGSWYWAGTGVRGVTGVQELAMYLWPDHMAKPQQARIFRDTFNSQQRFEQWGPGVVEDPYLTSLVTMLAPRTEGTLQTRGWCYPSRGGAAPPARSFTSSLSPEVAALLANPLDAQALAKLRAGTVQVGKVFAGNLHQALGGFQDLMLTHKLVKQMKPSDFLSQCVRSGKLDMPGVVEITGGPLDLPQISDIAAGGVVLCDADLRLTGNVTYGGNPEPLTLVSLNGDVSIGAQATSIDAFLVALSANKSVILAPGQDVKIRGGIAARQMDLGWASPFTVHKRVVEFVPQLDLTAPGAEQKFLRAYALDDVQIMAAGGS